MKSKRPQPFTIVTLLIFTLPVVANADSWNFEVNREFVEGGHFAADSRVAILSIDLDNHTADNIHYQMEHRKIIFKSGPDRQATAPCTFPSENKSWSFDCGLEAMSLGAYDVNYQWSFAVKEVLGNWLAVFKTRQQDEVLWLNRETLEERELEVLPLSDWLKRETGLSARSSRDLLMRTSPSDDDAHVTLCPETNIPYDSGWRDGGKNLDVYGFVSSGKTQGDWIEGHCSTHECFSKETPLACADELTLEKAERIAGKKLTPCVHGWIRWRSLDGKLLGFPKTGQPFC